MELEFLGHACVALRSDGATLLVDPYAPGQFDGQMAYREIDVIADYVACTHAHIDHAAVWAVPGNPVVVDAGVAGPFRISRVGLAHDEYGGRRRGGRVDALRIEAGGVVVLHLSDVGESPRPAVVEAHRRVDVLLVPVGGMYTIGAAQAWEWVERIDPAVAIPIHYRTTACSLPIRDASVYQAWTDATVLWNSQRFHVHELVPDRLIVAPRLV